VTKDLGSGKPRHEKLGVKPGQKVKLVGSVEIGDDLDVIGAKKARAIADAEWIVVAVDELSDLDAIRETRAKMKPDAAIWAVYAKGRRELGENHVREAARSIGLVDVKVMSWSATHTGLKLVIRKEQRAK
jgi:hypothetical protein